VPEANLVIEVDGLSHHTTGAGSSTAEESMTQKTHIKKRYLESKGYTFKVINAVKLLQRLSSSEKSGLKYIEKVLYDLSLE